ncbi:AGP2beta-2 [Trypanosoma grayi]|uniref:AGP2beta-2 n=1 Tax=Trypanosoma grayi TaxID=71804 RepID=UPI0004F423A4|nr:AGP2beta-2 [Trypanosoma grayi]KEG14380.1 AGP2beta-2 [Trypanosoma grayi]
MEGKITRDVRIVFRLSIDMVTGCLPGKAYIVHFKRGDKIHASSSLLSADEGGKLQVGMTRVFTSTLQRQSNKRYKKKELKIRIVEFASQVPTSFSYDLSTNVVEESFPDRRVVIKSQGGSPQLYLRLEGTEESIYNRSQGGQSVPNTSLTSYMLEASVSLSSSSVVSQRDVGDISGDAATKSYTLSDFEGVVESVIETSEKVKNEVAPSEGDRCEDEGQLYAVSERALSPPDIHPQPVMSPQSSGSAPPQQGQGCATLTRSNEFLEGPCQEKSSPNVLKGSKYVKLPPKAPSKRIVVSCGRSVQDVVKRIHDFVREAATNGEGSEKQVQIPKGAEVALEFYRTCEGKTLEDFVVHFVAYIAVEVCQETRHLGNWLSLLTYVLYRSILESHSDAESSCTKNMTIQVAEIYPLNIEAYAVRGKELIRSIADDTGYSFAVETFWLTGLDYCTRRIASISTRRVSEMCDSFPEILPFSNTVFTSFEERIIAGTTMLCSELNSVLSTLIPNILGYGQPDIRNAPPLYRVVLVALLTKTFFGVVTAITRVVHQHKGHDEEKGSYIALRVLGLLKSWARDNHVLSVTSKSLLLLVVYCDLILLPHQLVQNKNYRSFMAEVFPSELANKIKNSNNFFRNLLELWFTHGKDDAVFSVLSVLREFTVGGCSDMIEVKKGVQSLIEVLNGDEIEAKCILESEEVFRGTGFDGLKSTFYDHNLILTLLAKEV